LSYSVMMSDDFTYREFVHSDTAIKHGIENKPDSLHIRNGKVLFNNTIQKIRDYWGPVIVTSGYRNPLVNQLVGGVADSQHMHGQAVDFYVPGHNLKKIFEWCVDNLKYDQIILYNSWIHISYVSEKQNRNEVIIK